MTPPKINQVLNITIGRRTCPIVCADVFNAGMGYYVDAVFPKEFFRKTKWVFSKGQQFKVAELGDNCVADYVSRFEGVPAKVRFLII